LTEATIDLILAAPKPIDNGDDEVVDATPENTRGLVRKLAERGVPISQV
jgi:hypothetical protein